MYSSYEITPILGKVEAARTEAGETAYVCTIQSKKNLTIRGQVRARRPTALRLRSACACAPPAPALRLR